MGLDAAASRMCLGVAMLVGLCKVATVLATVVGRRITVSRAGGEVGQYTPERSSDAKLATLHYISVRRISLADCVTLILVSKR